MRSNPDNFLTDMHQVLAMFHFTTRKKTIKETDTLNIRYKKRDRPHNAIFYIIAKNKESDRQTATRFISHFFSLHCS